MAAKAKIQGKRSGSSSTTNILNNQSENDQLGSSASEMDMQPQSLMTSENAVTDSKRRKLKHDDQSTSSAVVPPPIFHTQSSPHLINHLDDARMHFFSAKDSSVIRFTFASGIEGTEPFSLQIPRDRQTVLGFPSGISSRGHGMMVTLADNGVTTVSITRKAVPLQQTNYSFILGLGSQFGLKFDWAHKFRMESTKPPVLLV